MKGRALLVALASLWMGACTTLRPAAPTIPDASEYRKTQAEIHHQQAELAITGGKIEEGSWDIIKGIDSLEMFLVEPNYDREQIINQVRELRSLAEGHQAEAEKLNHQLAGERETTCLQGELFDEREAAWQRSVSEREAENAALRVENKKIAGQRNLYLAILIAVCLMALGYIAFRVMRVLRVIPI
jgi:hypothetical protein